MPRANNKASTPPNVCDSLTAEGSPAQGTKSAPGWTKDQKRQLFNHVLKNGERAWNGVVEGKTGHQAQEQWKWVDSPHLLRCH
ncbi:hypothetical protein IAU60_001688 [Kwoniella sp. DSM 27419]